MNLKKWVYTISIGDNVPQINDLLVTIGKRGVGKVVQSMTRAYVNNRYVVMVYDNTPTTKGFATRAMIQKHDNTPIEDGEKLGDGNRD